MTTMNRCNSFKSSIHNGNLNDKSKHQNERKCYKSIHCSERMHTSCPISFSWLFVTNWKSIREKESTITNDEGKKPYTRTLTTSSTPPVENEKKAREEMRLIKVGQVAFSALFERHHLLYVCIVYMNSGTQNRTFWRRKRPEHTRTRTQQMAGYEILFSMVVCLLFAFGFASLRAVRALFVRGILFGLYTYIFLLLFCVSFRFVSFLQLCDSISFTHSPDCSDFFHLLLSASLTRSVLFCITLHLHVTIFLLVLLLLLASSSLFVVFAAATKFLVLEYMYKRHKGTTKQ